MTRFLWMLTLLFLAACSQDNLGTIHGKWAGVDPKDGIIVFHPDGRFESFTRDGASLFGESTQLTATWQSLDHEVPRQLFLKISYPAKTETVPLGIYRIKGHKLIIREPLTHHRTLGGVKLETARYEMPNDFSGELTIFKRLP
ncbi:MAG: hypothetical protein MI802_10910 [Desulfobacterales bacterium]|nr:hypothetical protein [Desulfobacterales bacterium]